MYSGCAAQWQSRLHPGARRTEFTLIRCQGHASQYTGPRPPVFTTGDGGLGFYSRGRLPKPKIGWVGASGCHLSSIYYQRGVPSLGSLGLRNPAALPRFTIRARPRRLGLDVTAYTLDAFVGCLADRATLPFFPGDLGSDWGARLAAPSITGTPCSEFRVFWRMANHDYARLEAVRGYGMRAGR